MKKLRLDYRWGDPYDRHLPRFVEMVKRRIKNNDDFRLLIVGDTGTGKSSLALHITDLFCSEPTIKTIGLNEKSYAKAVIHARDSRLKGVEFVNCVYDEANVYSTEVMKSFNREIMRLLGEIRGLNIFHIWCMPNPARLQQDFIDETFDSLIFINSKAVTKPRTYYFLSKRDLDTLRKKEGTASRKAKLSLDLLDKVAKKYATYLGCFRPYEGSLLSDYLALKRSKMSERVDDFFEKFGGKNSMSAVARKWGVDSQTVKNWLDKAVSHGILEENRDYVVNQAGRIMITDDGANKLLEFRKSPAFKKKIKSSVVIFDYNKGGVKESG